jgi:tellurium resistance protein TerD
MSVSLAKGARVSLSKAAPGLSAVAVALGWDDGPFDLDASALMLDSQGKVPTDSHFVF